MNNPENLTMENDRSRRVLAWLVHAYTSLGLVAAAAIAILIVQGGHEAFRRAFLLMVVAVVIDATDGFLARAVNVNRVLPGFDGRRLDDLIDFLTYSALPLLLIWRAGVLPGGHEVWLLLPFIATAYGMCQVSAKTDDGYFLGFPSYWNIVAFYLYLFHVYLPRWPAPLSTLILVCLALLTFVPSRYLYPTQGQALSRLTNILGAVWACCILRIWWLMDVDERSTGNAAISWWIILSLFYPVYYMLASWIISLRFYGGRRFNAAKEGKRR